MDHNHAHAVRFDISSSNSSSHLQSNGSEETNTVIHLEDYRQYGLSADAYIDADYFERECRTVFSQHWVCVGLATDVPHSGDVYPTDIAGMPIVLVRDRRKDGQGEGIIRAFHNICRHRGLQLVDAPCHVAGSLRCPYHSWSYHLDGTLKNTPHFGGYYKDSPSNFDRASHGLIPIRCEQWLDLIFVNVSGDAPPLEKYLRPVIERWSGYDFRLLRRESRDIRLQCNANWKLAIENFSESYHLSWVHPSLNDCSRMEDHFGFEIGDPHVGQGSLLYKSGALEGRSLPTFPNLEAMGKETIAEYITVFPNLMLGVHPDYLLVFTANPLSPNQSAERMTFYFVGDEAMTPENQELRHLPIDLWRVTNDEDIQMIERLQIGRKSPQFDGGCFSPELEQTVYRFQQHVAQAVSQ